MAEAAQHMNDQLGSPRYMQVYSTLRQWVTSGHYAPGSRIETENRLCEIFGVSRITVRKAIELLTKEGLITRHQGKGTFVSESDLKLPVRADMNQRVRKAREFARNSQLRELTIKTVSACDESIRNLKVKPNSDVVFVSYVRVYEDEPIGYLESRTSAALGLDFTPDDFESSTMLTILEDKGIHLSGVDHLIGATLADNQLAKLLNVHVGAPLVTVRMTMLDLDHEPVELVSGWFRADRYEHHMFLARKSDDTSSASALKSGS